MNNQPVAIGGAITAALISLLSVLALTLHLSPEVVFSINGFIVAAITAVTAVVHAKVVPRVALPAMPPPSVSSVPSAVLTIPLPSLVKITS